MRFKSLISGIICCCTLSLCICSLAISTDDFDNGMSKGIEYFNKGLYYEAKDEFQWFCDANWGAMNSGQQQYALDYLDAAKQKIQEWEKRNTPESVFGSLSSEERRKLNVFLSNFSEALVYNFDRENFDEGKAVSFAFIHNLINNYNNITYSGSKMGISLSGVNSTLDKYCGVSVSPSTKHYTTSFYSYGNYYSHTQTWEYKNGMFWTDAASGESYDYFSIVTDLIDLKNGFYKAEFNVYHAGYDNLDSSCYSYDDSTAKRLCEQTGSGYAIITKKYYNGTNTWNLEELRSR